MTWRNSHQLLDQINRVDVVHRGLDHPTDLLQSLEWAHYRHGVSVHQYVCLRQHFQRFECYVLSVMPIYCGVCRLLVALCPRIRCRRLTNRSLFRTILRILMMSHAIPSSRILIACGAGTDRARSLIKSRAFRIAAGSNVCETGKQSGTRRGGSPSNLSCCLHRHGTLNEIQDCCDAIFFERLCDQRPRVPEISLAVFGE